MKTTTRFACLIVALTMALCCESTTYADIFGSGANTFDINFVTIGNPGNADDVTGTPNPVGAVDYTYRIGKFEISEDMIDKANALGGLGLTHTNRGPNKPATDVSWYEAAQFVNWLNTDSGSTPAYKFNGAGNFQLWEPGDAGYNPNNLYRNSQAKYFLPSVDEWYKAAYYDPEASIYYDYPTGSNSTPDGIDFAGDPDFEAVFFQGGSNPEPNDITDVGHLSSPYGTAGQGGNVFEWEETATDLLNDSGSSIRGTRGGFWSLNFLSLQSEFRNSRFPAAGGDTFGFRVASTNVPEPSTLLLGAMSSLGLFMRRRA